MIDPRILLRSVLSQRLTPKEREALAAGLRQIADEQEQIAAAQRRDSTRPAPERLARPAGAKGGRPGAHYIYLDVRPERERSEPTYTIRIGRGVFDVYQRFRRDPSAPLRMLVQVSGGNLILTEDGEGYLVSVNRGGVRINVSGSRDHLAHLPAGVRWAAQASATGMTALLK